MSRFDKVFSKEAIIRAKRTAFVSKFIILREKKISQAHSIIERLLWNQKTDYQTLARVFKRIFKFFNDERTYESDIKKASEYAKNLPTYFIKEYDTRSGTSFLQALLDYEKSVFILFGSDYLKNLLGWAPPSSLARNYQPLHIDDIPKYLKNVLKSAKKSGKDSLTKKNSKYTPVVKIIDS